ncbi:MAG: chromosomal replication initiator protein DnaA [Candidatus Goldbacteria bacterium]|nr:chromosomal replication initiator protein DnaA [Candidatus Goldiibacteriota bacterium]
MKNNEMLSNEISNILKNENTGFSVWLEKSTILFDDEKKVLTIKVPDALHKKTLINKYNNEIIKILKKHLGYTVSLNIEIKKEVEQIKNISPKISIKEHQIQLPLEPKIDYIPSLNSRFRFENFIVGDSNKFAHAACRSVAEAPGQTYNPLFIYGGVGLGKTHLLHAIGNYVYEHYPSYKIIITTAEKFLYEVVQKIRESRMDEFKEKYRSADLLLVDDIEFLQKGEAAKEEFFHTFNELYNLNKQIVATSDSSPQELKLEERLKSRFGAGIIVDILPPNFEMRVAILKQKAKELNKYVPDNVIGYIAEHVENNIRYLGSTLLTMFAIASQNNDEITIDIAKQAIKITNPSFDTTKKIGIDMIQQCVSEYFGIKIQDLTSRKRPDNISKARQIAMYIARQLTDYSLVQIGQYFGGKDHTTVMHAINKIEKIMNTDEKFKKTIEELMARIKK